MMPEGKDIILNLYSQQWCSLALLTPKDIVRAAWTFLPFVALGFIYQVMEYFTLLLPNEFKIFSTFKLFFLQKQGSC